MLITFFVCWPAIPVSLFGGGRVSLLPIFSLGFCLFSVDRWEFSYVFQRHALCQIDVCAAYVFFESGVAYSSH